MGIDIYARWNNQSEEEKAAQVTGFSAVHGHVGYLREAYHGEPYATRALVPEAFEASYDEGAAIPAAILRERLPHVLEIAIEREATIYGNGATDPETNDIVRSYERFVALCEAKEAETGEPCRIIASY